MEYTKQQRTDIANAFKAAKPLLYDGRKHGNNDFICHALMDTGVYGWDMAIQVVSSRIYPESTFRNWLDINVKDGVTQEDGHPKVQQHRHAWVDQLIEEFSV